MDLSWWEVTGVGSSTSTSFRWGGCDRAQRCQAPRLRGQNLRKNFKSASMSKTADLSNVNCHLTPPPPSHWAPAAGQGWRGNLIKGSPVTKDPPSTPGGAQRQARRNNRPQNGTGSLSREGRSLTQLLDKTSGRKIKDGTAKWGKYQAALLIEISFICLPFNNNQGFFNSPESQSEAW